MRKPKLAIYGDSYTLQSCWLDGRQPAGYCWSDHPILTALYDITNYGVVGSSFVYSYELWESTYKKYDKTIFIVTDPFRHSFNIEGQDIHVSGLWQLDHKLATVKNNKVKEILNALKLHYMYTLPSVLYTAGQEHLVSDLINAGTIVEYAFDNKRYKKSFTLDMVSLMEEAELGVKRRPDSNSNEYDQCIRPAHMSVENNKIFATYLRKKLNDPLATISLSDFKKPIIDDKDKYFITRYRS